MMKKALMAVAAGALTLGIASPAGALTLSGQSTISRPLGVTSATAHPVYTTSDPVVIHAPSMASSEGCPDEVDDDVQITMIHADGTEYNCNTGDYTIR